MSYRSESYCAYSRPQDIITSGLEKEREKFHRSMKTMERIYYLREEAKIQADMKRKRFEIQGRIISQNRNKKKQEFQKVVESNEKRRAGILSKKYEILSGVEKEMAKVGIEVEKRMAKLEDWQKAEITKQYQQKMQNLRKRLEEERRKKESEEQKTRDEKVLAGVLLEEISQKLNERVAYYENTVQKRVQSARAHSVQVNNTMRTSFYISSFNDDKHLRQSANKSLMTAQKREKKTLLASESSEKMKKMLRESFQTHKRGISDVSVEEAKRLERINERFREKQKHFDGIQKNIHRLYEEKRQKNYVRMEKHFQSYIEKQREEILKKQKVLEKHKRMSLVADELNNYRTEVAMNKRRSNLEVQRIRSSRVSPSAKYSFVTPRRFDRTL
jgi:hypothetical protein